MTRKAALRIRIAAPADARDVLAIYGPLVEATSVSFEEQPPSRDEIANRIADSYLWLVAEAGSEVIGYAYAGRFHSRPAYRWSAEISIYLAAKARGTGLGRKLLNEPLNGSAPVGS